MNNQFTKYTVIINFFDTIFKKPFDLPQILHAEVFGNNITNEGGKRQYNTAFNTCGRAESAIHSDSHGRDETQEFPQATNEEILSGGPQQAWTPFSFATGRSYTEND